MLMIGLRELLWITVSYELH